uniref:Sporulation-specific protein 15-like n=1 Tax=Phallusia mammillata TaxID=59560 RepID=A0A6F9D753_9ASCI|nr:sporulation-specific protein 15-like [Phallusia mammillata]
MTTKEPDSNANLLISPDIPDNTVVQEDELTEGHLENELQPYSTTKWTEDQVPQTNTNVVDVLIPGIEEEKSSPAAPETLQLHTHLDEGNPAPPPRGKKKSVKKEKFEEELLDVNKVVDEGVDQNGEADLFTKPMDPPQNNELVDLVMSTKPDFPTLELTETSSSAEQFPLDNFNVHPDTLTTEELQPDATLKDLEFESIEQTKVDTTEKEDKEQGNMLLDVTPNHDEEEISSSICSTNLKHVTDINYDLEATAMFSIENQEATKLVENLSENMPMAPPRGKKKIAINVAEIEEEFNVASVTGDCEQIGLNIQINPGLLNDTNVLEIPLGFDTENQSVLIDTQDTNMNLKGISESGSQGNSDQTFVNKSSLQNLLEEKSESPNENGSFVQQNTEESNVTDDSLIIKTNDAVAKAETDKKNSFINKVETAPVELHEDEERLPSSSEEGSLFGSDQINVSDLDDSDCGEMQLGDNISQISLEFDDNPFESTPVAPLREKRKIDLNAAYLRHEPVNVQSNIVPSTVFMEPDDMLEDNDSAKVENALNNDLQQMNNEVFVEESLFAGQTNLNNLRSVVGSGTLVSFDSDWEEFQQSGQPINTLPVIEEESEPEENDEDQESDGLSEKSFEEIKDLVEENMKDLMDSELDDDDDDLATQYNHLWGERSAGFDSSGIEESLDTCLAPPEAPGNAEIETLLSTNPTSHSVSSLQEPLESDFPEDGKSQLEKDLDESPTTTEGSWCILDQTSDYEDWKDTYTEPSTTNEQLILSGESKIADTDLIDVYTSQTQNSEDQTTSTTDEKENDGFFNEATIVSSGENLIQDKGSVPTENDKDMLETPKPLNVTDLKAEVTDNDLTDWTINTIERNENLEGDSIQDAIHESSDGDLVGMENSIGKTTIVHANEESDGDGETSLVKKGDQPSSGDVHTLEPSRNVDFAVTEDSVGTTTIDHSHEESQNVELLEPGEIKPCDKLFEHFIPVTNAENDVNMLPEIQTTDETSNVSSITPDKGPSNMFDDETATQSQTGPTPMLQGQHDIDTETPDVTHNQEVISQYNNNLLSFGEGETTEKYITVPVHVKPNNIDDTNNMDSSPDIDTNLDSKSFEVLGIGSAQNVEHHDIFKEEVLTPLDTSVQEQENVEDAEIAKNCQVSMNEDDLVTHDEEKHLEEMVTAVSTEITAKTETYKEEQVYDEQHTISANTLEFEDLLDPVNLPTSEPVPNLQNNAKESSIDRDASEFPLNTDAPMIGNEEMTFQPTEPTQEENRDAEKLMDENNLLKPMIADFMLERENIAVLVEAPASDDVALNNGNPNTDTKLIDSLTPANQVESMVTSIKSQTSVPEDGMPVDKAINLQPDDNESCTESDKQNKRVVVDESLFGEQELHSTGIEEIVLEQTENAAELEEQNIPVKLDETVPLKEVSDVEVTTEVNLLPGHIDESLFGEKGPDSTTVEESVPYTQGAVHEVEIQNQDFTTNEGSLLNAPNNVHVDEAGAQNQDTTEVQEVLVDNHVNSEQQLEDVVQSDVTAAGDFDPFSFTGEIDNNPQLITDIADKIELATEESDAKTHDQADLVQVTDEATSEHVDQIYRVPTNSFQDLNVGDQIFADPVSVKPLKKLHLQPDEAGTNTEEEQEFTRETNRVRYDTIGSIDMLTDSSEDENETQEQFNAAKAELVSIDLKNDADDRDATNETVSPTSSLRRRSIVPPSSLVLSIALDDINVQTPTQETQVDGPSAPSIGSNSSSAAASSNGEKTDPEILLPTIPATMKEDPVWENVVIGNEDYRIDGRAIQNYKRVISHGGFYKEKQAIVEIFGRYLPDSSVPNYIWVMDNLFLYLVSTLELLVQHQDYVVVFFNGSVSKNHFPSTSWLKKSHLQVPYHLRKNLKGFYVVQSSFYFKTLTGLTRMFLSRKVFKKTKNVKNHTELKQFIPTDFLFIPQDIASKSSNSLNDEQVNKKWWWSR